MTSQFGKPSTGLLNIKKSFFEENDSHLETQRKIASIYKEQPRRTYCKNCGFRILGGVYDFIKDGIEYVLCERCNHLNGMYEDTNEFCDAVYTDDSGSDYAKNYTESDLDDYNYRTACVYSPKAEFLYTSLVGNGIDPHALSYLDFGAGSGYFVSALKKIGLKNIIGTEVSEAQVNYGNDMHMIGDILLKKHNTRDTDLILGEINCDLVSMIGVLEHLQSPRTALACLQRNKNIKYLYISIPTFSLSVYLEIFAKDIFNRQLHGGHTHLYTQESIEYFCKEFGFETISEWWFGTDIVDLYRCLSIELEKQNCSLSLIENWKKDFIPIIDAMQLELDKKKYSSEVHLLLKKV